MTYSPYTNFPLQVTLTAGTGDQPAVIEVKKDKNVVKEFKKKLNALGDDLVKKGEESSEGADGMEMKDLSGPSR